MKRSIKTMGALAASFTLALAATACAPGGSTTDNPAPSGSTSPVSKDVPAAGDVTLTVWDQNTDTGINDAQVALNTKFQQKYPNVKIERVSRSTAVMSPKRLTTSSRWMSGPPAGAFPVSLNWLFSPVWRDGKAGAGSPGQNLWVAAAARNARKPKIGTNVLYRMAYVQCVASPNGSLADTPLRS